MGFDNPDFKGLSWTYSSRSQHKYTFALSDDGNDYIWKNACTPITYLPRFLALSTDNTLYSTRDMSTWMFYDGILETILKLRGADGSVASTDVSMFMGNNQLPPHGTASMYTKTAYPATDDPWKVKWSGKHSTLFPLADPMLQQHAVRKALQEFTIHPTSTAFVIMGFTPTSSDHESMLLEFELLSEFTPDSYLFTEIDSK